MKYLSKEFHKATVKVYLYCITNLITSQQYIGQTTRIKKRWQEHIQHAKAKRLYFDLYIAMREYRIENFVFEVFPIAEYGEINADNREKSLIKQYNTFNNGYNMTEGGDGVGSGPCNPRSGRQPWNKDKHLPENFYGTKGKNHYNYNKKGEKNHSSKKYRIYFKNGTNIEIHGLLEWCRENEYSAPNIIKVLLGERKSHKDIIKVERLP